MTSLDDIKDRQDFIVSLVVFNFIIFMLIIGYILFVYNYPDISMTAKVPHEHLYNQSTDLIYDCTGRLNSIECGLK